MGFRWIASLQPDTAQLSTSVTSHWLCMISLAPASFVLSFHTFYVQENKIIFHTVWLISAIYEVSTIYVYINMFPLETNLDQWKGEKRVGDSPRMKIRVRTCYVPLSRSLDNTLDRQTTICTDQEKRQNKPGLICRRYLNTSC